MGWKERLASTGAGFLISGIGYELGSIILIITGAILIGLSIVIWIYDYLNGKKLEKYAHQIDIEPLSNETRIIEILGILKLRFSFRVINRMDSELTPKNGKITIYHEEQKIDSLEYDPQINKYDGARDALYMDNVGLKEGKITLMITIPSIKEIYTWKFIGTATYGTRYGELKKVIDDKIIISNSLRDAITKKFKRISEG